MTTRRKAADKARHEIKRSEGEKSLSLRQILEEELARRQEVAHAVAQPPAAVLSASDSAVALRNRLNRSVARIRQVPTRCPFQRCRRRDACAAGAMENGRRQHARDCRSAGTTRRPDATAKPAVIAVPPVANNGPNCVRGDRRRATLSTARSCVL